MRIRATLLLLATAVSGLLVATGGPASANVHTQSIGTYGVHVKTGDIDGAGTDARVRLTVFGTDGQSPGTTLDNGEDNFERGKLDRFGPYKWVNFGAVDYISLGKGQGSDWYVEYVEIDAEHEGHVYMCRIDDWYRRTNESETRYYACHLS
jgi:hypothetical protein